MMNESSGTENCEIKDDVYKQVLPLVFFNYLSVKDQLKARQTSKLWNEVIVGKCSVLWWFRVCNNPLSIDAFKNLSPSLEVHHFRFENLDLEACILGNPDEFRRFSMGHCLKMRTLAIRNCQLGTGRFLELLAFCKSLNSLTIRSTPSLYSVNEGIGILHWGFCFKYVLENLSKVQNLSIWESSLSDRDIVGLGKAMTSLVALHVGVGVDNNNLPIRGINEVLKASSKTLKTIQLRGAICHPGLDIGTEIEMDALERIVLLRCQIGSSSVSKQLEKFLNRCPKLHVLKLQNCKINKSSLWGVLQRLTKLELVACDFGCDAFEDAQFEKLTTLKLLSSTENISEPSIYECAAEMLLKCPKPELKILELQLSFEACNYLKYVDVAQHPKLNSLTLNSCIDIAGKHLRKIFRDFQGLESLSLKNCEDILDDNLCTNANNNESNLADLKNLKTLNLDGTCVGNRTVHENILKMTSLEVVHLSNTQVDEDGIRAIIESVPEILTSLRIVSMKTCKFSSEEYKHLCRVAPSVKIECSTAEISCVPQFMECLL